MRRVESPVASQSSNMVVRRLRGTACEGSVINQSAVRNLQLQYEPSESNVEFHSRSFFHQGVATCTHCPCIVVADDPANSTAGRSVGW